MIVVRNLEKQYGEVHAVRGLSFTVPPGQILGLIGPNGAGKTTTMRIIAGIIPPTSGTVSVAGRDIRRQPLEAKAALAYVPDDPALFGALTVYEHLVLAARAYGVKDYAQRAEQLLERFHLADLRDKLAEALSRGARQKVAICTAYIHDAPAVLFDEPLTGLDPHAIRTMKESIREQAALGKAFIVSSHLLSLIEDLCTHLLVVHKGQALFAGTVAEGRALACGSTAAASLEETFFRIIRDSVAS